MINWIKEHRSGLLLAVTVALLLTAAYLDCRRPVRAQTPTPFTLAWTSPGDDGSVGTAYKYEMRYSVERPDTMAFDRWWWRATIFGPMPSPQVAGTPQTVQVPSYLVSTTLGTYFVLRTTDEAGNISRYSNIVTLSNPDSIPPDSITTLRKL